MKRYLIILLFLGIVPLYLQGQVDTVIELSSVVVSKNKIREEGLSNTIKKWNTEALNSTSADNIAELLEKESSVFIKSYGLNSLATSSIRGGSANQTLVLWNGLPIQSPMLGLLDLSLLPVYAAEEVILQKGGSSALWGRGAIGGVLSLKNQRTSSNKTFVNIGTKIGAFGEWKQEGKVGLTYKKIQSVTKFSHHQAKNDFFYFIAPNFPRRQQTNAQFSQQNFLQDIYFSLKKNQQFSIHFWYQNSDRQIPPTNVQNRSEAYQFDQSTRLILDWKINKKSSIFNSKIGLFTEKLEYVDPIINIEAPSHFTSLLGEFDTQWALGPYQILSTGIIHTYTRANATGYVNPPEEFNTAIFASYRLRKNKFTFQTSIRQALIDERLSPLVPVFEIAYQANRGPIIRFKISKNYRSPTLNDRYWNPGGNEALLAESGWSEEFSLLTEIIKGKSTLDFSISIFNKNIDNWILWSIREGQSFWSANNITKVWSRGLEPRIMYRRKVYDLNLSLDIAYDYIRSTNEVSLQNPRIAKGEQLIYVPKHQASSKIGIAWNAFKINYQHQYVGATHGINDPIKAYQIGDLGLSYGMKKKPYSAVFSLNLNNLWDANYFVIDRRPMPGRHWQLGLKLNFKQ